MQPIVSTSSRRNALRQMAFAMAGVGLCSMNANAQSVLPNLLNGSQPDPGDLQPFLIPPSAPLQPGPGGLDIRVLIKSAQTNGQFSCVEFAVAEMKMGPAPHYHKALDELMYVLEGTATVMVEDQFYEVPAGGWHLRPHGKVHTFFNKTDKPVRAIDMYFNQNFEDFLEEVFHHIVPEAHAKNLSMSDPAIAKRMQELHEQFGMIGYPERRQPLMDQFGLK